VNVSSVDLEKSLRADIESYVSQRMSGLKEELERLRTQLTDALARIGEKLEEPSAEGDAPLAVAVADHLRNARNLGIEAAAAEGARARASSDIALIKAAVDELDAQQTQADILNALVNRSAAFAPRVAFFVVKGERATGWRARGLAGTVGDDAVRELSLGLDSDTLLGEVVRARSTWAGEPGSHAEDHTIYKHFGGDEPPQRIVAVPLVARDRAVGALNAYYASGCAPDDDELAFLTAMADQAAVAVENARLIAAVRGEAALGERHRLARDLHDSACQRLFSMTLHLRAAELAAPAEPTGTLLHTLEQLAHEALDEMRALIFELHPTLLDTHGLVSAVREQAAWVTRRGGPAVTVDGPAERLSLAPEAELDVYRLAQEALHNSVKHAAARQVHVHVAPAADHPDTLLLEITDDGCGFEPAGAVPGLGLVSMRERAERLGGQLTVTARPGAGTTVRLVVPRALGDAT
jgi:signal transduction histidine kinase